MARTPLLNLRVDEATKTRWQDHAEKEGVRVAEMIRSYVEAGIAASAADPARPSASKKTPRGGSSGSSRKTARVRTEPCEHRRRPDEYCSRCDS